MSNYARISPPLPRGFRAVWLPIVLLTLGRATSPAAEELRADLWTGVKDAIIATDKDASQGRCVVAKVADAGGKAFAAVTPNLKPGVYDAVLRMKLPLINSLNTGPLKWTFTVSGAGEAERKFDILLIERAGAYQDIPCRFVVERPGKVQVSLEWQRLSLKKEGGGVRMRVEKSDLPTIGDIGITGEKKEESDLDIGAQLEAEPPLTGIKYLYMAVDRVAVVPVSDVDITRLEVDKVRYKPGEKARVSVEVRNHSDAERALQLETVFVSDLDTVIPVDQRAVKIPPDGRDAFECAGPAFIAPWGYAVRCRVSEAGKALIEKSECFTVHSNMWGTMIAGRGPAQFTAHVTRENAVASALDNKRRYRNWVESGFWAPDEFGDFTPKTEFWWGGQGCYYGSRTGTKIEIEEGHKVGISYAVYSNVWGGDGPPAFDMIRRHPDWGHASGFNVEWLDRWERNTMGTGKGLMGMHVWPMTVMNYANEAPFVHHGRELIGTHKMFGWDAVRYDSHAIDDENARVVNIVKRTVYAEVPDFQFGYNSSVPQGNPPLINAFKEQCRGEGLIMEEGIRQYGGGGMSFGGQQTYEAFAKRILDYKDEARKYGGHFCAIGMDECFPNDLVYQHVFWLAGNTHPCYDWLEVCVANYMQFATRFAGLLWDLRVTNVPNVKSWVDFGEAASFLWIPERYVHQRDLGGGRRQLIVHLINTPLETNLAKNDDAKVPAPRENVRLSVKLPGQAKVRGVWFLTPEYELTQKKLEPEVKDGRVAFTVPKIRFWSTAVVDLENAGAFE